MAQEPEEGAQRRGLSLMDVGNHCLLLDDVGEPVTSDHWFTYITLVPIDWQKVSVQTFLSTLLLDARDWN